MMPKPSWKCISSKLVYIFDLHFGFQQSNHSYLIFMKEGPNFLMFIRLVEASNVPAYNVIHLCTHQLAHFQDVVTLPFVELGMS